MYLVFTDVLMKENILSSRSPTINSDKQVLNASAVELYSLESEPMTPKNLRTKTFLVIGSIVSNIIYTHRYEFKVFISHLIFLVKLK